MDAGTFQAEAMKIERLLWRVSWSMLGNSEDCADAIQDALARAWQRRDTLRDAGAFRSWLTRILSNVCTDMLRKRARRNSVPLEDDAAAIEPFAQPVPLREAMDRLTPEHRAVIVLHYLEGYSVDEIADLLGAPTGTVKSRMTYARRRLRTLLSDDVDA